MTRLSILAFFCLTPALSFCHSNQFLVRTDGGITRESDKNADVGDRHVILPSIMAIGTVSRRAVEATWLTASNSRVSHWT